MNRHRPLTPLDLLVCAGVIALAVWMALTAAFPLPLGAAPAPFPKPPRRLTRAGMVGTWVMHWGTVRSTVVLTAAGGYTCTWPGATYEGTWGLAADGRFWISESCFPQEASSWMSYAVQFGRYKMRGPLVVGPSGIEVSLERP